MDKTTQDSIEAAVFRRLIDHLDMRKDAQNIDLMGLAGFCRNCLSDWYQEAAADAGVDVSKDAARERIYGMPYGDYKAKYQGPATDAQLDRMNESVALNKKLRAERT
ncbi:hypothetical protein GCM10017044_13520 [Kordiimonas sediminis]|uniref:SMc04008-like domain-containing protein n=1 Tax=Kordiimonas sediminis TaxID=1735581 RepID=A0A919AQN2_9PROT|nr:DUF1244 domain-containing protein [Kordiimonas sediminis]GHF20034.1 hypothetical protein GCM10017044_13520 [Kordiimonas sediminis]